MRYAFYYDHNNNNYLVWISLMLPLELTPVYTPLQIVQQLRATVFMGAFIGAKKKRLCINELKVKERARQTGRQESLSLIGWSTRSAGISLSCCCFSGTAPSKSTDLIRMHGSLSDCTPASPWRWLGDASMATAASTVMQVAKII